MIIEFSIANFRSFKEMATLSMTAAAIRSQNKELDISNTLQVGDKLSLLRSKAIYGANASGKSNLIKAFVAFKRLVRQSVVDENIIKQACDDFVLGGEVDKKPVFYQLLFLKDNIIYRYGCEVMHNAIVSEWLFSKSGSRESKLFTREGLKVSVNASQFSEAKKFENLTESGDSEIFQSHSLFLSATAAVGVKTAKALQQEISRIDVVNSTDTHLLRQYGTQWWMDEANREKGIELIQAADTGVERIGMVEEEPDYKQLPKELQVLINKDESQKVPRLTSIRMIEREGTKEKMALETYFESFESEGTQKFAYLIPLILDALETGSTLWIDEFDTHLHPLLTKKIVSLFHSSATNPHGAQLIFTTHDTNLLKPAFLRRDQVCFVEKDRQGASHLKTLVEYKGVRNDASYDKDYLQGRYGAVPFLNELDEAVQNGIATHE